MIKNKEEVIPELKPKEYYFVNGMVESKEKTHYNFYIIKGNQIDCYQIQKDRLRCLKAKDDEGYVIMKSEGDYKNLNIEVNFRCFSLPLAHDAPPSILIKDGTYIDLKNK